MTARTVRAAIATYFAPPVIPWLNEVATAQPPQAMPQGRIPVGQTSGATGWVFLSDESDTVIAWPQPGWRQITYRAALIFDYVQLAPVNTDTAWADNVDDLCEAVKDLIRHDPTLGTATSSNPIWQAGIKLVGEPDAIQVMHEQPLLVANSPILLQRSAVVFPVIESILAT